MGSASWLLHITHDYSQSDSRHLIYIEEWEQPRAWNVGGNQESQKLQTLTSETLPAPRPGGGRSPPPTPGWGRTASRRLMSRTDPYLTGKTRAHRTLGCRTVWTWQRGWRRR